MAKRPSEAAFGRALRGVDDHVPTFVLRIPDPKVGGGVSNWKPCDYIAWSFASREQINFVGMLASDGMPPELMPTASSWFECKDTPAKDVFNLNELRPSQRQGIREATRLGIPYWLAVYWRRHDAWTISDAFRVTSHVDDAGGNAVTRDLLMTRFGIEAKPDELVSVLKSLLAGEVR